MCCQYITQRDDKDIYVQDERGDINQREDPNIVLTTKDETTGKTKTTSNTVTITAEDGNTNLELNGDNIVLSGMFLLAAGFVLDRKNRRMN